MSAPEFSAKFNPEAEAAGLLDYVSMARKLRERLAASGEQMVPKTSLDEFIERRSKLFKERVRLPRKLVRVKSKECYLNAWHYWLNHAFDMHYCEGYVALEGCPIPVLHGWCVDAQGRVHDPSVAQSRGAIYLGMRFKPEFVDLAYDAMRRDDWQGIGILQHAWEIRAIAEGLEEGVL